MRRKAVQGGIKIAKKRGFLAVSLLLVILLTTACSSNRTQGADGIQVAPKADNYTANYEINREVYQVKNIEINYPKIINMSDQNKQEKINEIIKKDALEVLSGHSDVDQLNIKIDYEIKLQNSELLSVVYTGYRNVKGAAHPTNEFYTTNINLHEGNKLRLINLVNIDENFAQKVYNGKLIAVSPDIPIASLKYDNGRLKQGLQTADVMNYLENKLGVYSYFTKDSLGISTQVSHAYGDHVEWEVRYQDISGNLKSENGIWKSLFR